MGGGVGELVVSGPVLLAMPVAAAAGAITFLSPCCLPLVPGYLSYLAGMTNSAKAPGLRRAKAGQARIRSATVESAAVATGEFGSAANGGARESLLEADGLTSIGGSRPAFSNQTLVIAPGVTVDKGVAPEPLMRARIMLGALLFVLGFSVLFAIEGITVTSLGDVLLAHKEILARVLGSFIIVLGLIFIGAFDRFNFAGRIFRPTMRPRAGLTGAPLLGVLFGLSWTPCSGPTLSAVLILSSTSGTALRGGVLAFTYALGVGIPFLAFAFAFQRGLKFFAFARRHARLITQVGGLMLIAVGVLEVTGAWTGAIDWLQAHWLNGYTTSI